MKGIHEFLFLLGVAGKSSRSGCSESEEERMPGGFTYHRPRSAYSITLEWILLTPTLYCCEAARSSALPPISFTMALSCQVKLFEAVRTKANPDESHFLRCFNSGNILLKELVENYWKGKHLYNFALENGRVFLAFMQVFFGEDWESRKVTALPSSALVVGDLPPHLAEGFRRGWSTSQGRWVTWSRDASLPRMQALW